MTEGTGKAIVVLLAAILGVLLVGRETAIDSLVVLAWIGGGLVVLWIIWKLLKVMFGEMIAEGVDEVRKAKAEDGPVVMTALGYLAGAGNFIVVIYAVWLWADRGGNFGNALLSIPYFWAPIVLLFVRFGLQKAETWIRKRL